MKIVIYFVVNLTMLKEWQLRSANFGQEVLDIKSKTWQRSKARTTLAAVKTHNLHLRHHQQWQEASKHPAAASLQETNATYESSPLQALPKMSNAVRRSSGDQLSITTPHFVRHYNPSSLMTRRMLLSMH